MKRIFVIIGLATAMVSCESEETATIGANGDGSYQTDELKRENYRLLSELAGKDSTINYYVSFVNEIRENLNLIQNKQKLISSHKIDSENLSVDNTDLVEELRLLGSLMSDSERKIARLKSEMKNSEFQMGEFETMIISLTEEVEIKNMEIFQMHQELENLDGAFSELFEAFEEQAEELETVKNQNNTAFFTFGTKEELLENGVITKEGGFIGIGKISKLKDDFNKTYFTEIKIDELKELPLGVKKAEVITTHPSSSYALIGDGTIEKLVIKDAVSFWGTSKYLVLVVK